MGGEQGGVRRLAFAGALTALAAAVAYLEQIPWLELQSLVVFAAGCLLGVRTGALVGALSMAFYSAVNPYGLAPPLVFAAQVAGRAAVGVSGGWAAKLGLPRRAAMRAAALAAWGVAGSLAYDLLTNVALGLVFGRMGPTLLLAAPFALGHLGSNAALFVVAGGPLLAALEVRRAALTVVAAGMVAVLLLGPADPAWAQAERDTLRRAPADTLGPGVATPAPPASPDTLDRARAAQAARQARADSLAGLAEVRSERIHAARERLYRSARWGLALPPSELSQRAPQSAEDAFEFLASAPRFYPESGAVEPLLFAALPAGLGVGAAGAGPLLPRAVPWEEPVRLADGGALSCAWSALPTSELAEDSDSAHGATPWTDDPAGVGRSPWLSEAAPPGGSGNLSSVWLGLGENRRMNQGFALGVRRPLLGLETGVRWEAWTKRCEAQGELGQRGAHGLLLGVEAAGAQWSAEASHSAERVSLVDALGYEGERRGGERTRVRARWWERGGAFAGLAATRVEDRLRSEGLALEPLWQRARDLSAGLWGGARLAGARVGARAAWLRQSLAQTLGEESYDPEDLDLAYAGVFADGRAWGGEISGALDAEFAEGEARLLPRLSWRRRTSRQTEWAAAAGALSGTALGATERVLDVGDLPAVERPQAWAAQLGLRYDTWPEAPPAAKIDAAPGQFLPGRLRLSLTAVAWSAREAGFPAYGLFAREVILGPLVTADVEGASLVGSAEWAPTGWAQVGASGYAAARTLPDQIAMAAPDWRALLWGGPRLRLFTGSLELWLAVEADCIGQRLAADAVLPAIVRPGARLALGLGDAWLVLRMTDLDGARHPLPATRADGERLRSPGRLFRFYAEWRFLD